MNHLRQSPFLPISSRNGKFFGTLKGAGNTGTLRFLIGFNCNYSSLNFADFRMWSQISPPSLSAHLPVNDTVTLRDWLPLKTTR